MGVTSDSIISNPFSTGSGGATFEQLVGASYLVSLLAGHVPRGLEWGVTTRIRFQQKWSGCVIDDVVVVSSDGSRDRKLALQLKHDLNFTQSDETFARVVSDCWAVFNNSMGWPFDPEVDRVGIGLGVYQTKLDTHFRPLLEWARTEHDAATFLKKIGTSRFSSVEKREYLALVRALVDATNGNAVEDEVLWRFLRCFVVIHFDLENAGSRDTTHCWNTLLEQLQTRDDSQAHLLFDNLCALVARHNRTAGTLDVAAVRAELPVSVTLKDQPQFMNDLKRLRSHSQTTLASIRNTIGLRVQLPRTQTLEQIVEQVKQKEVVVIAGEPMVGKSGLLKLLATRLQLEGETFSFLVEEFASATTLADFLHNNGITHDFADLLAAVGDATLRCILVDGLERATNESKQRVINDLLLSVRQYNDALAARGGHSDYRWRVVFTCRAQEMLNILVHLTTRQSLSDGSLSIVSVEALTEDELAEAVELLPKLRDLAGSGRLKELLSRPLVLDILTLPDITLPAAELPSRLTETWLLDWFWQHVVRLAEQARIGRGHPDIREQLLLKLASQALEPDRAAEPINSGNAEALSGLVSDRLLHRSDGAVKFGHDVLEDWSLAIILRRHFAEIVAYIRKVGEPLRISRAFQLAAVRLLEVDHDTEAWLRLLRSLEVADTISPRWHTLALSALLGSDLNADILPRLETDLLANDNALLIAVLRTARTFEVRPSSAVYSLKNVTDEELEKYLAYWNLPIWRRWIPIVRFFLQHRDRLTGRAILEFSHVARKWMENTNEHQLFRAEIAGYAIETLPTFLIRRPWNQRNETSLSYKDEEQIREDLAICVLQAADCSPDEVAAFVRQYALRSEGRERTDLEDTILLKRHGWIPLCKHLPDLAVDILEGILCDRIRADHFGSYHYLFMDLGISSIQGDIPPTPEKGPFRAFLRFHAEQGLELIQRVVSHATRVWVMREQMEWNRQPVAQLLSLAVGNIEVWGDEKVYQWYRFPSVGPTPVTCALMALEDWMNEQLQAGSTLPKELFERVLRRTNSVAIVGVCTSVALSHMEQCLEAIVPIIERPAYWHMDIARFVEDRTAESSAHMFSTSFSLGNDKSDYQMLMAMARQPQRQLELRNFIPLFLVQAAPEVCERVQAALRTFPEHPAIFFEDERENEPVIQSRVATYRMWAAFAERENYQTETLESGAGIAIRFKPPQYLEEERRDEQAYFVKQEKFLSFQNWCITFLNSGEVSETFTFDSALAYAQELASLDDLPTKPGHFLLDAESRADVIALFAAGLVLHAWEWVQEHQHIAWCREQLLIAAKRPAPALDRLDEVQIFNTGYRRSAARALPVLLAKRPHDSQVRQAILALATYRNREVRAYLFSALSVLWDIDDGLIWACSERLGQDARKRAIRNRFWMLEANPDVVIMWGRFPQLKRLRLRASRASQLLLSTVWAKPITQATCKDISDVVLESILYLIPTDHRIAAWGTGRAFELFKELVTFTVNNFLHFQEKDKTYNEWEQHAWNHLIFERLAGAMLRFPPDQAHTLVQPILADWQQAPSMMEELLRHLSLMGTQADLEERLIDLWLPLADKILGSDKIVSSQWAVRRELHEILGLLIFADPAGIVAWNVREWVPLRKATGFIDEWVERVGHDSDCFRSLVRLLRGIGFYLMPEFGVVWLYKSLNQVTDLQTFFEQGNFMSALAQLLFDTWKYR